MIVLRRVRLCRSNGAFDLVKLLIEVGERLLLRMMLLKLGLG